MAWGVLALVEFAAGALLLAHLLARCQRRPQANPFRPAVRWITARLHASRVPAAVTTVLWLAAAVALAAALGSAANALIPLVPAGVDESVAIVLALGTFGFLVLGTQAVAWGTNASGIPGPRPDSDPAGAVPDRIAAIRGFRIWRVVGDALFSLSDVGDPRLAYWQPLRAHRAACGIHDDHQAPHPACTCGIYAVPTPDWIAAELVGYLQAHAGDADGALAVGPVKLWGRVCEHEHGWRAACAYPGEPLLLIGGAPDLDPEAIAGRYGVRCIRGPRLHGDVLREYVARLDDWHEQRGDVRRSD
jgi:hypothetical protein